MEHYTHRINSEKDWQLEGIYADKGISGTSVKKRDEFNRMIRRCKQGKIDMIIRKSIARFARNTVDCLKYVRTLKDLGVDVYFEEQGIHSNQPGAEFYITIYGSIAQSESENISANVKWGKAQSAKEGKVNFHYQNFLGYRKGTAGKPEIVPEEAETIRLIYGLFLAGYSLNGIAHELEKRGILSPAGKEKWQLSTVRSILSNEKYKGDAIINKTYITDCISKKVRTNNGERPKYYVENSHPAIIDSATFGRVQEELARRSGKHKVKQVGTKTEQGKLVDFFHNTFQVNNLSKFVILCYNLLTNKIIEGVIIMLASKSLQRYIELCDDVIYSNDSTRAEELENEIVSIFSNDINEITNGLSNYSLDFFDPTIYETTTDNIDFIKDIKLLKSKLQVELERNQKDKSTSALNKKQKKIFISHASSDKQFVELFVNLMEDIGLSEDQIVCSSIPGYGIPLGKDIYEWLSEQFQNFDLHIVFILSSNYYQSVACLNEMGATWVLKQRYDTILLPNFDFPQIKGAINPQQIGIKIDSERNELNQRLNELKDNLLNEFELQTLSAAKWERHRNEFVDKVTSISYKLCNNKIDNSSESVNSISKDAAVLLVYAANDKTGRIIMLKSLSGLSVYVGKWNFINTKGGAREEAKWNSVIDELVCHGLIEDSSYKHQFFVVTNNGYKMADELKEELKIDFDNSPNKYLIES